MVLHVAGECFTLITIKTSPLDENMHKNTQLLEERPHMLDGYAEEFNLLTKLPKLFYFDEAGLRRLSF